MSQAPGGEQRRIAFIGLGLMGVPLCRRLLGAGHALTVYDVDRGRCDLLGLACSDSPASAASAADVVITSLPSPQVIEQVAFGPAGVAEGIQRGSIFVDMSTNAPEAAKSLASRFAPIGVDALDAPVSGGPRGAAAATLSIMVGGSAAAFERCQPLFQVLGALVVHVGPSGAGQVAKLCNNLIGGVTMVAISEACDLASRQGVDPGVLYELLCASTGDSRVLRTRFAIPGVEPSHPATADYQPLFSLDLMLKDLRLALAVASEAGAETSVLEAAVQRYTVGQDEGHGGLDYSAVHLARARRG